MPVHRRKICSGCGGGPWPLRRFYHRKDSGDGHTSRCKACILKANRENKELKIEHYREYDRRLARRPDIVAKRRAYLKTPDGKAAHARAVWAWRVTHPEAYAAQKKASAAARKLKRENERAARVAAQITSPPSENHNASRHHRNLPQPRAGA